MDALSRLLMLNDPQGSIDQNCLLSRNWQLPHAAGELSVIRWHTVTQGAAQLDMPDGTSFTLRRGLLLSCRRTPPIDFASQGMNKRISFAVACDCTPPHAIF